MGTAATRVVLCVLLTGVSVLGCAGPDKTASTAPVQMICKDGVTAADVIQAAEYVLSRMQFPIEKLDVPQGIVRTRPLRGAQFFEFWRSDNVGAYEGAEAGLQSLRRSVELRVTRETVDPRPEGTRIQAGGAYSLQPPGSSPLRVECTVAVQRLSLPGKEITGVSAAYAIYARSAPMLQRTAASRQPRPDMTWIDVDPDRALAARILDRIDKRLKRAN